MTKSEVEEIKSKGSEEYNITCIQCGENIGAISEIGDKSWTYECKNCGELSTENYDGIKIDYEDEDIDWKKLGLKG